MATDTVEDYIKQIFLEQHKGQLEFVPMGKVSKALNVVSGTVTTMVKSLSEQGYLIYKPRKGVSLTDKGNKLALFTLRKHRLIEVFLVKTLQLDWSEVHCEAERLEHAVSDLVLDKLDAFLGYPARDPHGSPIPTAEGNYDDPRLHNLVSCDINKEFSVSRISSQTAEFLQFIDKHSLRPGNKIKVVERNKFAESIVLIINSKTELSIGLNIGQLIFVDAYLK